MLWSYCELDVNMKIVRIKARNTALRMIELLKRSASITEDTKYEVAGYKSWYR